jgi:tetratricopeptide (TPR) repeat protein
MNRQASILFIDSSFSGDSLALKETSAQHSYYQRLICSLLSQSIYTKEGFQSLAKQLTDIARHAYLARQTDIVEQVSQVMLALPISGQLRSVTRHYQALCTKQKGDYNGARKLLERVVEEATPQYKARALQVIGATYHEQGNIDASLPFYLAACKASISCDPSTLVESQRNIALIRSIQGDHKQALEDIENLFPLVRAIAKQYPLLYYSFLNSLAVELGEVGRINEAQAVCNITLTSPFAPAYPEFAETRDEIAAKRPSATPSVVAVSAAPEPVRSSQTQPEREVKPVRSFAISQLARPTTLFQRSVLPVITATTVSIGTIRSILDRVRYSVIPRSPPFRFLS